MVEGERTRIQAYEGVCIGRSGSGINENFTVRKISYGEGVERVFPLYSPLVDSIKVVRRGKVRRAKLYYLRGLRGKSARIVEKKTDTRTAAGDGRSRLEVELATRFESPVSSRDCRPMCLQGRRAFHSFSPPGRRWDEGSRAVAIRNHRSPLSPPSPTHREPAEVQRRACVGNAAEACFSIAPRATK